jgi:beta-glucosidase
MEVDCQDIQILMFPDASFHDLAFPETAVRMSVGEAARPALGGGIFSTQDHVNAESAEQQDEMPVESDDESDELVALFGYRVTLDSLELMQPKSHHWSVTETIMPLAVQPESRNELPWWTERYVAKMASASAAPQVDVLLVGDSITHSWDDHLEIWEEIFPDRTMLNLGFSGDRTEHVLWRLQDGSIQGIQPSVVMLMIGTNNTGHRMDPPADVAAGISAIVEELKARLPDSRILLLGVFPRGATATSPDRLNNLAINELVESLADNRQVVYLDIGASFFAADGTLTRGVGDDFLHLTADGYHIWAEAVKTKLDELLNR